MSSETEPKVTDAKAVFRPIVQKMIADDRLPGLARYLKGISLYWSNTISTACAGHGFIFFNKDFYDSLPHETCISIVAHEVWHLIRRHLERGKGYDHKLFNIAADHAINLPLIADGFTFEGTEPLADSKYTGMSTEEIYNDLIREKKKGNPPPSGMEPGKFTSPEMVEDLIKAALGGENSEKALDVAKDSAETKVKTLENELGLGRGGNDAVIDRLLELDPTRIVIDNATYQEIYGDYLRAKLKNRKRSFGRPSRRMPKGSPIVLPGRAVRQTQKNRLMHLVYALDISGSISDKMIKQFHNSVNETKKLLNPEKMTILFFNTKVTQEHVFTDRQSYTNLTVKGKGGTKLDDVYRRARELNPEALVVFSDMDVTVPPQESWDSIWIVPHKVRKNCIASYGKTYLIPKGNTP